MRAPSDPCRFPPTARPSTARLLRDDVYRRLRDAIVDGTFAPGEQLRDLELAAWLGVSRTPVREALLRLAQGGLVVAQPGRSTVVSSLDARGDPRRPGRRRGDARGGRPRGRRRASPTPTSTPCATPTAGSPPPLEAGDVDAALRADDELHGVPVAVAGNRALDHGARAVHARCCAGRSGCGSPPCDGRASVDRHDELIRLCAAGDVEGAAAVAFDTWHSLPSAEAVTPGAGRHGAMTSSAMESPSIVKR